MANSNSKINTLLQQRQKLREDLAGLREDIDALDASAISILTSTDMSLEKNEESENSKAPDSEISKTEEKEPTVLKQEPTTSEPTKTQPDENAEKKSNVTSEVGTQELSENKLILHARLLAAHFLEHPAPINAEKLMALDIAINKYDQSSSKQETKTAELVVKDAYRAVASESNAKLNINGQSLEDSANGSWLIWAVPLLIAALVIAAIPAGTLVMSLIDRMLEADFANDVKWVLKVVLAFTWGCAGALSLVAFQYSLSISRKTFQLTQSRFAGIWAALGGLVGAITFLLSTLFIDVSSIEVNFSVDLISFLVGILLPLFVDLIVKLVHMIFHSGANKKTKSSNL